MTEVEMEHPDGLPQGKVVKPSWKLVFLVVVVAGTLLTIAIFNMFDEDAPVEVETPEELPEVRTELPSVVETEIVANIESLERMSDIVPAEETVVDEYEATLEPDLPEDPGESLIDPFATLIDDQYQARHDKLIDALHVSPLVEVDLEMYPVEEEVEDPDSQATVDDLEETDVHTLNVGSIIPAALISGINSDIPGTALAQVSQNVYDSTTGSILLIPQGSKLTGVYDTNVNFRQNRIMVRWDRVVLPSGEAIELDSIVGSDQAGFSGFKDEVDNHLWQMFGASALTSIIAGASTYAARGDEAEREINLGSTATSELGRQWGQTGQEMMRRHLEVRPTIRINSGFKFAIVVTQPLDLPAYAES